MLHARAYVFPLESLDISFRDVSREYRILGKIFEIAPADRQPLYIHARAEHDVDPLVDAVVRDGAPELFRQLYVPAVRERLRRRISD
jgi:hypothetical protein